MLISQLRGEVEGVCHLPKCGAIERALRIARLDRWCHTEAMDGNMDVTLYRMLERYLADAVSCADLIAYLAGFDIWNRWQDGDPEIERARLVVGEIDHLATLAQEGLVSEDELRQAIREALAVQAPS